ncbi:BNR-repeat neuraminidase N-terminal domain-containing protein [Hymenobacter sp. ASUV-10]|uniref:BNR-repeat neuraminidase N-terminal domain-containing protein n=1 Tax=Hymenobacter aranciens TaxID=3063996 RepID=A0ABT9B553_9BACT|nr:BNR-repeat neuraminidase N-terminal domain-containing protein [Hymenobacter sp. ASUV-10]MDO7873390.1 BNR-repeat neuraminidase N-terminal domain-containing protein [Hymenobacter sp. ASUV-10]
MSTPRSRYLTRAVALLALLLGSNGAWAQLSGTKTIPGDYATVAAAITALNSGGVGPNGVTFDIAAGYTETFASATAGQITLNNASTNPATVARPVVFKKAGAGANPVITGIGTAGANDAILSVVGTDYVTFTNINVTAASNTVEYGYALFRVSATDGSQNVVVTGSTITLDKTSTSTIGIYSAATGATGTAYTASSSFGANSNNAFRGNVIANSFLGVNILGATATVANMDTNNVIGATGTGNGNTMTNLGGSNTAVYGINAEYQAGLSIVNNTVSIPNGNTSTAVTGIGTGAVNPTGMVGALTISQNAVTIATASTGSGSGINIGIKQAGTTALTTVNITNNTFTGWNIPNSPYYVQFIQDLSSATGLTSNITGNSITGNSVSSNFYLFGLSRAVYNSLTTTSSGTANITGNTISNNTFGVTGLSGVSIIPIYATGTTANIGGAGSNANVISNNTSSIAVATVRYYPIYTTAATSVTDNNTITNETLTTNSTGLLTYPYFSYTSVATETVTNNTIVGISVGGTGTSGNNFYGIYSQATGVKNIANNTVGNLTLGTAGGSVYGPLHGIYNTTGSTVNISRNKVYGLTSYNASAPAASGLFINSGTTVNASNNIIGGITTPDLSSATAVAGILVNGGSASNIYNNTVYLNASSSGTNFGTSGIFLASTTPTVTLINNIVVNKSTPNGTGLAVALRRTATALAGYSSSSNNNLYFAGTPGTNRLLYYDGTNSYQTLAAMQAAVAPRETNSRTEDVPFASTTGSASNFLHIAPGTATFVESGGVVISGVTTDYDGDARGPYTGTGPYSVNGVAQTNGGGYAPDLGADEGDFTSLPYITVTGTPTYTQYTGITGAGATNQAVAALTIVTAGQVNAPKLNSLTVDLGSTPVADIQNVQLYVSSSNTFSLATATLVPTTATPAGTYTITVTGGSTLAIGNNYYYLTYNIAPGATPGDVITSAITSITINTTSYTPTLSGAAGALTVTGPMSGPYTIDQTGSGPLNYTSFTAAITDLNARGINTTGSGVPVTFNVAGGQTFNETGVPAINRTGIAGFPITFRRDPAGSATNPILQVTGTSGTNDAALAVAGGDYFTFSNLTITQPTGSSALEYGIAFYRASATDGSQNNTVQNCTITLSTANASSAGIYSAATTVTGAAVTTSSAAGAFSNNKFYSNTISNVAAGIYLNGVNVAANYDTGNDVGGAAAAGATTGNTITNFGGTAGGYGIYAIYQSGALLNNNTINNAAGGSAAAGPIYGVYQGTSTATSVAMSYNTVTLSQGSANLAYGVYNLAAGAAANTASLTNNIVTLSLANNFATTNASSLYGVYNAAANGTVTLTNNSVTATAANTGAGSYDGGFYGVYNTTAISGGALTMTGNIVNLTATASAAGGFGSGGPFYGVGNAGAASAAATLSSNNVTIVHTVGGTAGSGNSVYGVYNASTVAGALTMSSNTVANTPTSSTTGSGYGGSYYGVGNVSAVTGALAMNSNTVSNSPTVTSTQSITTSFFGVYNTGAVSSNSATAAAFNGNTINAVSSLTSTGVLSGSFNGVYNTGAVGASGAGSASMSNNNVLTATGNTYVTTAAVNLLYNTGVIQGPLTISSNTGGPATGTATFNTGSASYLIFNNNATASAITVSNNNFRNLTSTGNGSFVGYYDNGSPSSPGAFTFNGNTLNNITLAGSAGLIGVQQSTAATQVMNITNNTFTNLTAGTGAGIGINATLGAAASVISGNTITGFNGGAALTGIVSNSNIGSVFQNTVGNLVSSGGSNVYGINNSATTTSIYQNKIYGLSGTAAGSVVAGIYLTAGTTVNLHNNLIGTLTAPAATSLLAVTGINMVASTTVNAYYNTIYLNASSSAATFGTSGIYFATGPNLTLRNNIIVNTSTAIGTGGYTAALRRVSGTNGTVPANYQAASNNNLFYAGAPSSTNLLYVEGTTSATNPHQRLDTYKAFMATRDQASVTENPPFASTTGSSSSFLHINPSVPTQVESGGAAIATYTTDFDGDTRNATTPDLGADEGTFTPSVPVTVSSLTYTQTTANTGASATNQVAASLTVTTAGSGAQPNLTAVTVDLTGTSNVADIAAARLYRSNTSSYSLASATLVATGTVSGTSINFTGSQLLDLGSNYFFLVYDIAGTATSGDQITSAFSSVTIGGTPYTGSSTPAITLSGAAGYLSIEGPMQGTYTINQSGSGARNYTSFTAAINDLNARGINTAAYTPSPNTGPVIFNVSRSQTFNETSVPVIITTGIAGFPITFQRDPAGAGANPILQVTGTSGTNDAALAVAGGDYFVFSGLDITQPSGLTSLEYGIALYRASVTNGAQNNTVQNCNITLSKANVNSTGIFGATTTAAGVAVAAPTSVAGANSGNKFYNNIISNVTSGIVFNGSNTPAFYDLNNDFGGTAGATTGNTVNNFGSTASSYGIYAIYQSGALLNNNIVNNTAGGGSAATGAIYGVFQGASTATNAVLSNNNVTLSQGSNNPIYGVYNAAAGAAANSVIMSGNTVVLSITSNSASDQTGYVSYGVWNAAATGSVALNGNTVTIAGANTAAGSYNAGTYGVYNTGAATATAGSLTLNNNIVTLSPSATAGGGFGTASFNGVSNTGAASNTLALNNNNVSVAFNALTGNSGFGQNVNGVFNTSTGTAVNGLTMNENTVSNASTFNVSTNSYGAQFYGVYNAAAVSGTSSTLAMNQNTVSNTPTSYSASSYTGGFYGVYNTGAVSGTGATAASFNTNNINGSDTFAGTGTLSGAVYGVYNTAAITGGATMNSNNLFTNDVNSYRTTGATYMLYNTGAVNNAAATGISHTISNNTFGPANGIAYFNWNSNSYLINNNSTTAGATTVSNNTFQNINGSGTGAGLFGYYNYASAAGDITVDQNTFTNIAVAGTSTLTGVFMGTSASQKITITNNTFTNLATGSGGGSAINYAYGATTSRVNNNTIAGFTSTGGGALSGVLIGPNTIVTGNAAAGGDIFLNNISGLSTTGAANVNGVSITSTSAASTVNIYRNKIYDLSGDNAGVTVNGLSIGGSIANTVNVYNNLVGNLTAPNATGASAINGMLVSNSSTSSVTNISFNSVYLAAFSAGANFGTSGIFISTDAPVNLRNNIFVNASSPNGTYATVAYRRGTTISVTNAPVTTNDRNLYYAGGASANTLLYAQGTTSLTNTKQTIADFKAYMGSPREANSGTEFPNFISTTGSDANFLHIDPTNPTQVESGGINIAGITTDYEGDIRQGNPGYPAGGGGTAPDIGADEGTFLVADLLPPTITFTAFPNQAAAPSTTLSGITITDNVNVNVSTFPPRLYFRRRTDGNVITGNTSATDGWKYVVGTLTNTSATTPPVYTYSFNVDYSLLNGGTGVTGGETIDYFIVAQDRVAPANVGVGHGNFPPSSIPTTVNLATANLPTGYDSYLIVPVLASTYTVGTGQPYPNLTGPAGLFNALNGGIAQSNIVVNVTSNLTEPGNIALNQLAQATGSNYSITIRPDASVTSELLISGPGFNAGMIRLNGADNVTFDGGASRYFRFQNLNTVASPTFTFLNDAVSNTITRSVIESGNTSTSSGTVLFYNSSTAVTSTGNDNNNVTDNDIRGLSTTGGATHANAVYSVSVTGTGTGTNSGITISNNRIYDWTSGGVIVPAAGNGNNWTISGNSFYQTATRTTALTAVQLVTGSAHTVTGNSIGGANATRGGAALTSSAAFIGIAIPSVASSTHTITNNVLANIANTGSSTNYGISFTGTGSGTISGNRIGMALTGGVSSDTVRTNYDTYSIYNTATGTVAITNNVVNRVKMTSTGGDFNVGIFSSAGTNTITGNTVANLTTTASSSTSDLALSGIYVSAATAGNTVSNNTVYNIVNSTTTASTRANGIFITGVNSTGTATLVERNRVYNVANTSLTPTGGTSGLAVGIRINGGAATYANNMVSMGANTAGESRVSGIENASAGTGTNNFYYNSVYVNGAVTGTVNNSYAFQRSSTSPLMLRNNVFYNERTGGGAAHVALLVSSTTGWTATTADNNYLITVDASKVVSYNGTVYSMSSYQSISGGAPNSLSSTTSSVTSSNLFVDPATANLHVGPYYVTNVRSAPLESRGVAIAGFTTDYDNDTRPGPAGSTNGGGSNPDIGADEFDGRPAGTDVTVVTINGITFPVNAGSLPVTATVRNLGNVPLTSVSLTYTLNGGSPVTQSFTGLSVAPNATTPLALGSPTLAQDINTLVVTSSLPNGSTDEDPTNDTQTLSFRTTLVGAYTINKAAAASNTNFVAFMNTSTPTVNAAASSLAAYGVNGAVTFAVSNGAYTEQVLLPTIAGTSATNTVAFNGNGQTLTFAPTSTNIAVVAFTGADYTTLNNFVINPTGTTYGAGVILSGQSNNNSITNNVVSAPANVSSTTTGGIAISNSLTSMTSSGDAAANTVISGNTISGGYYGISMSGPTATTAVGNQILNNTVRDFYTYGIYSTYQNAPQILGNDISRPTATTVTTFNGIYMTTGNSGAAVERNRIHDPYAAVLTNSSAAYGVYIAASATAAAPNDYVNNVVYNLQSAGTVAGFYNFSAYAYQRFYHNSVSSDYTTSSSGITYGYYQSGNAAGIELKNNIFKVTRTSTGSQYGLYFSTAAAATAAVSDYNDLYVMGSGTATNYYTGYNGTARTTLALWQTNSGLDANSVAVDPLFANAATGNLKPTTNAGIDGIAPLLPRVPNDITLATRNSPTDPGAYEFTPAPYDIEPAVLVSPVPSGQTCFSSAEPLSVTIRNTGFASTNLSTITPATVSVSVLTPSGTVGPFTATLTGTIAGNGGTLPVTIPGTVDMTAYGDYVFTITTNVSGDGSTGNDVLTVTRTVAAPVAGTVSPAAVSLCQGQTQVLTVAGTANGTIYWQQSTNGTTFTDVSPVANGTTYTATATPGVVAYRVQVRCNSNVANSNLSTFTVDNPQPVTASASPSTVCEGNTTTITATKTSSQSAIRFYSAATGGTELTPTSVAGNTYTYTTPALAAGTTNYYVAAVSGATEVGGKPAPTSPSNIIANGWGMQFTANSSFTLQSTTIYPTGTGTVNIALYNNAGVQLAETGNISVTGTGATTPVVVPLNFPVPTGTNYRLLLKAYSGISNLVYETTGISYPYNSPSGALSVNSAYWDPATTSYIFYFYNFVVSTSCEGLRTAVPVTVTPAPSVTITPSTPVTVCQGAPVAVTGTADAYYNTFTYSATAPAQASDVTYNSTALAATITAPTTVGTYIYTLTASNSTAGAGSCQAIRTITVNVIAPTAGTLASSISSFCTSGTPTLTLTGSTNGTIQYQQSTTSATTGFTNIAGATSATYTPAAALTQTTYFRVLTSCDANVVTSNVVTVTNVAPPTPVVTPASPTICNNTSTTLTAAVPNNVVSNKVLFSENFNAGLGSFTVDNASGATAVTNWALQTPPFTSSTYLTNFNGADGTPFVFANSDAGGSGSTTDTRLVSASFSTLNASGLSLTFDQLMRSPTDTKADVEYSIDGGSSWTLVPGGSFTSTAVGTTSGASAATATTTLALPAAVNGQANVKIRFNYIGSYDWYWIIDNVRVTGNFSEAATYAWTLVSGPGPLPATTNTASLTVSPADNAVSVYRVTATYASVSCSTSNDVTVTTTNTTTWTGAAASGSTTNWYNAGNWTTCVPSATIDAVIPTGLANYPTITSGTAPVRNLTIQGTGTLTTANSGTMLDIKGNFVTAGVASFTAGTGTMTSFSGATAQAIGSGTYYNVAISGSGATAKSLGGDVVVNNNFDLTNGMLDSNGHELQLNSTTGSFVGAGTSHYVVTNANLAGHVRINNVGPTGRASATFPIGTTTTYTPATLTNTGDLDYFVGSVKDGISLQGTGTSMTTGVVGKTWDIAEGTAGGSNATLTLQWNAADERSFNRTSAAIVHYENGAWNGQCYTCYAAAAGSDPYTLSRSNITTFSPFAVQDNTKPLPVELTRFEAVRNGGNAILNWNTATEKNNAGFEVQVSTNGSSFRKLQFVEPASANSNSPRSYVYNDVEAGKTGLRYYRLRQVDLDGKASFSPVRTVDFGKLDGTSLTAMPNPFSAQLMLNVQTRTASPATLLTVTDATGRTILTQTLALPAGQSQVTINDLERLPVGMYLLHLTLDGQLQHVKVVKK